MKSSELKTKSLSELSSLVAEKRSDLIKTQFRHKMGTLEKTADIKNTRRLIARINTIINEKVQNAETNKK
jgi:large subunit ribosomal protein L29